MVKQIRIYIIFIFLIISAVCGKLNAQDISVKAFTDTSEYSIGDYIHYTVQVTCDKNITIITPDIKKSISNVDVLSEEAPKTDIKDNKVVTTYNFILSRYDSAEVTLPPVPVKYGTDIDTAGRVTFLAEEDTTLSTAYSNEVKFTVYAVKVNVEEDIKDIKAPLTIPPDWKVIALWITGGLLLLAILYYLYKRYKRNKVIQPVKEKVIVIPPHIKALEELSRLDKEQLWQKGEIRAYHTRITNIIRNYFEERFNLPALELSTTETIYHLRNQNGAGVITELSSAFLNNADLVKFAKYIPLNSINEEMMKQALEIVNRTAQKTEVKEVQSV